MPSASLLGPPTRACRRPDRKLPYRRASSNSRTSSTRIINRSPSANSPPLATATLTFTMSDPRMLLPPLSCRTKPSTPRRNRLQNAARLNRHPLSLLRRHNKDSCRKDHHHHRVTPHASILHRTASICASPTRKRTPKGSSLPHRPLQHCRYPCQDPEYRRIRCTRK